MSYFLRKGLRNKRVQIVFGHCGCGHDCRTSLAFYTSTSRKPSGTFMLVPVDGRFTTHTRRWRFSGPVTDLLCKQPFAEFFEKNRIRCKRSLPDFYQRCGKPTAEWPPVQIGDRVRSTHCGPSRPAAVRRQKLGSSRRF